MNNDSTPEVSTSASIPLVASDNINTAADGPPIAAGDTSGETAAAVSVVADTPAQERAKLRMRKRSDFLGDLLTKLDMTIYMELCILYYIEYVYINHLCL